MTLHALAVFLSVKMLPLIYAVVGFGALIAIHECGHFVFCKLFGIHTPTFSIGFGPEIFRKQIGRTNFRLAAIPLGGYVEIAGLAEAGQGEQESALITGPESFDSKPWWQKFCVLSGGIVFNLLFAYLVFSILFMIGSSEKRAVLVAGIVKESAAETYGLKPGDAIMKINDQELIQADGAAIKDADQMLRTIIRQNPHKEITLHIERGQKIIDVPITLGVRQEGTEEVGLLGAEFRVPIPRLPFFRAIAAGFMETNRWIGMTFYWIKRLVSQRSLEGAGGPVMIMSMSFGAAQHGLMTLFTFLALISINLAVLNMIPLPVLDGGQILFVTVEALIGRRIPLPIRNGIHIVSWLLLLWLAIFLTYKDIATLFGSKITALYNKVLGLIK